MLKVKFTDSRSSMNPKHNKLKENHGQTHLIKAAETESKEKTLKVARGKQHITYRGTTI